MSDRVLEIITCYSLIDITATGVVGTHKADVGTESWMFRRNQQRNWETMLQLIGLRAQPVYLKDPVVLHDQDLTSYRFSSQFQGNHRVWTFEFASEHDQVFGPDLALLMDDVHNIPVNVGLDETVEVEIPLFDTRVHHNVYFQLGSTYK